LVSFKKRFVLLMKGTPNKVRTLHTDVSMAANVKVFMKLWHLKNVSFN
jgi:hypothetical protein